MKKENKTDIKGLIRGILAVETYNDFETSYEHDIVIFK